MQDIGRDRMRSSNKNRQRNKNQRHNVGNVVNRVFDSAGPEGKVRGTPQQIIEKYTMLARDAGTAGDRVMAENFLQHAEHYIRLLAEAQRQAGPRPELPGTGQQPAAAYGGFEEPEREEGPLATVDEEEGDAGLVQTPEGRSGSPHQGSGRPRFLRPERMPQPQGFQTRRDVPAYPLRDREAPDHLPREREAAAPVPAEPQAFQGLPPAFQPVPQPLPDAPLAAAGAAPAGGETAAEGGPQPGGPFRSRSARRRQRRFDARVADSAEPGDGQESPEASDAAAT
jgi:hypothetical protein